ncbi:MAG: hypothetical protein K0S65_425 [Labilithrix sp.]|nr:hypothetical protein [Labilithrix sp.]
MSGSSKLARRSLLKGAAGGILIGLPLLEVMTPRVARAAPAAPKRFIVSFAGTTHGSSRTFNPPVGALPATLPAPCGSLAPVRTLATMVSGLAVPTFNTGTTPIPGGRLNQQHGMIMAPMLAGMQSREAMPVMANGHTVDQVVADAVGGGTRLKSVQTRIQAAGYGGGDAKGISSARLENGKVRALAPIASPSLLFGTLFGNVPGGTSSGGPTNAARKQRSILDFVLADATTLTSKVSAADRVRLDQHFTELRELELRLSALPPVVTASCTSPTNPGTDPALGSPGTFGGWSNETVRGDLVADMIGLALACDVTRAVSLMLSYDQSFLKSQDPIANYADVHATGHSGTVDQIGFNANWHVGRFAKMVKRLADTPEGGGTLLDSTVVVMVFAEGTVSHNSSDMTAFIAGMPSRLRMGQHIASGGAHPARLMISAMQAMGMTTSTLGEVSGAFAPVLV